jgi:ABC-type antimicrobial peptide transport system permease subunit
VNGIWRLAVGAIRARPLRSTLTATAVALGIAVVLAVQLAIQGLAVQAEEALVQQAGASSLDVRVDAGSGITAAQIRTLAELPDVLQAAPLYEKEVTAGPAGTGLLGDEVTLVGLQDSMAALRSISVVAGRLPLPGDTSEVAIDQGLSAALTGAQGGQVRIGAKIQLITATGPDAFTVVGFTSGTSGGPSFTRNAVFIDDAALTSAFGLGLHTPLVALRFGPSATFASVSTEVHARLGASVTTYDPRAGAAAPLQDLEPMLVLVTVLSLIVGAGVTANSAALAAFERRRSAPRCGRLLAPGLPALRRGGGAGRPRRRPDRHRRRPRSGRDLRERHRARRPGGADADADGPPGLRSGRRRSGRRAGRWAASRLRGRPAANPHRASSPPDRRP